MKQRCQPFSTYSFLSVKFVTFLLIETTNLKALVYGNTFFFIILFLFTVILFNE